MELFINCLSAFNRASISDISADLLAYSSSRLRSISHRNSSTVLTNFFKLNTLLSGRCVFSVFRSACLSSRLKVVYVEKFSIYSSMQTFLENPGLCHAYLPRHLGLRELKFWHLTMEIFCDLTCFGLKFLFVWNCRFARETSHARTCDCPCCQLETR